MFINSIPFSHQTALVSWQLRVGFKYSQNRLFLELVYYLNQALTLVMLLILPESFPGGCGALFSQQPLLQLALPNRSGCCGASLSCHTCLLPSLPWQCQEYCPGFNTSPTPTSPFCPYGWTHPSTDLRWSLVRGREKEDLRWERPRFCAGPLLVCILRCAIST